jgi:hypothetical protein
LVFHLPLALEPHLFYVFFGTLLSHPPDPHSFNPSLFRILCFRLVCFYCHLQIESRNGTLPFRSQLRLHGTTASPAYENMSGDGGTMGILYWASGLYRPLVSQCRCQFDDYIAWVPHGTLSSDIHRLFHLFLSNSDTTHWSQ